MSMIHFLFFAIISINLLRAVPMEMFGVKPSTDHSHRSVQTLQTMISRLFPSKKNQNHFFSQFNDQSSENSEQLPIIDRQVNLSNCTNINLVNASILLDQRDNNRFENSSLRKGYQWLFNENMIEDPIDPIKEVFPWELKDSIFDDDLYTSLNRKKFFSKILKNSTDENLNDAIHPHNSTIHQKDLLFDLSQALKTLESIVDDDDDEDDDVLSWKFLPFLKSHPKHH